VAVLLACASVGQLFFVTSNQQLTERTAVDKDECLSDQRKGEVLARPEVADQHVARHSESVEEPTWPLLADVDLPW
jgi:hypothetical protein